MLWCFPLRTRSHRLSRSQPRTNKEEDEEEEEEGRPQLEEEEEGVAKDNVVILFPPDRSIYPRLPRTRKSYPHCHSSMCCLPLTSAQEDIERSNGSCHFLTDQDDSSNLVKSTHFQGHTPRHFSCDKCPSDRPTCPFPSQPYLSAPFLLTDRRFLPRNSSPPSPGPFTSPSQAIEDPLLPPRYPRSHPLIATTPSLSSAPSLPPPSRKTPSQPLRAHSPPSHPVVPPQSRSPSHFTQIHSPSPPLSPPLFTPPPSTRTSTASRLTPQSPPPLLSPHHPQTPSSPSTTASRLTPQSPPPLPLPSPHPPQSPSSPSTTDPRLLLTSPPLAPLPPTPAADNANANHWPITMTRSRSSLSDGTGSSGTTSTAGTGGQSKLRYLIQARNALFHSDNMYQPVGTLDTRSDLKLRIALIQQRIWLVRQSHELSCCAKCRRRVRYIVHPRSWRLLRELRAKLDTGPVSSMREEPGALNQRIQIITNRMIFYDGAINEREEDEYCPDEQEEYRHDREVHRHDETDASSGVTSDSERSSLGKSSSSNTTPAILEESDEEGMTSAEPTEVVVEVVEVPSSAE